VRLAGDEVDGHEAHVMGSGGARWCIRGNANSEAIPCRAKLFLW
jgi:hypothetical protein